MVLPHMFFFHLYVTVCSSTMCVGKGAKEEMNTKYHKKRNAD